MTIVGLHQGIDWPVIFLINPTFDPPQGHGQITVHAPSGPLAPVGTRWRANGRNAGVIMHVLCDSLASVGARWRANGRDAGGIILVLCDPLAPVGTRWRANGRKT